MVGSRCIIIEGVMGLGHIFLKRLAFDQRGAKSILKKVIAFERATLKQFW